MSVVIAIDLGGTAIKSALVDEHGAIIARQSSPTGEDRSPSAVVGHLVDVSRDRLAAARARGLTVRAIGLGSPGGVRPDGRVSQSPNFPGWRDVALAAPLSDALGLPIAIDNDANLAAFGEQWLGAGRDEPDLLLVTLGTGVGGGLVLDGRIRRGAFGMAGEVGHMTVEPSGPPCGCGSQGCLETFASATAIMRRANELCAAQGVPPPADNARELATAARSGDRIAREAFQEAGWALGVTLGSLLNAVGMPLVLIGGAVSASFDLMAPSLWTEIRRRAFTAPAAGLRIAVATLGNDAGFVGAARLAWQMVDAGVPASRP